MQALSNTLSVDQVSIFLLNIDSFNSQDLLSQLSTDERARADRFRIALKRQQYIVTRAVLKCVLAYYLGKDTKDIRLFYGQHNKPYIRDTYHEQSIEFNVSHSDRYALIALTLENRVGIDIEIMAANVDLQGLSKRYFSEAERAAFMACDASERLAFFYRIWTRKESFIKATGQGVSYGLTNFSVPLDQEVHAEQVRGTKKGTWFCYDLFTLDHYKVALTIANSPATIISNRLHDLAGVITNGSN